MQSEHVNEIFSALSKAQSEIEVAIKDSNNPFFKSKYADLSSVWKACKDAITKNNMCTSQTFEIRDGQPILVTILGHASGQWIKSYCPVLAKDNSAQAFGSAVTYARRYALAAITGVIADDDDDGEAAMSRTKSKITPLQVRELTELADCLHSDRLIAFKAWLQKLGYDSIQNIEIKMFNTVLSNLKRSVETENKSKSEEILPY